MSDISTQILRPELTGLPRARYHSLPYTGSVPLTLRNSTTMLEQVEAIKAYIISQLTPQLDSDMEMLVESWNAAVDKIIADVVGNSAELQDEVLIAIASDVNSQFNAYLTNRIKASFQEDPDDEGTFIIGAPIPVNPPGTGNLIPDPNNPGFWMEA